MLEVRPDLPKQVCSLRPRRLPPVSPRLGPLAARSGSSEERGSPPGTEAAACRGAAEPLIPVPRLAAPIPRTALPRRPPQKERSPRRPPGPSSSSPASSPPSFLGVWLSLRPPLPSITDVLNQPKDLCQGWVCSDSFLRGRLGGAGRCLVDSSLRGQCTRLPRAARRTQRQDFAEGGFLFLFPWKNETTKKKKTQNPLKQKKTLKRHISLCFLPWKY